MLELRKIVKEYLSGDEKVEALRGIDLKFRKSEFVSILGPSGCGKTTLLNIIGGLDRYTSGDLLINNISTRQYKPRDWDSYRNHKIGFVFQSYNLIPHQSVLSNVELALTLSGVSKSERRARAKQALEKVGLGDQLRKKPNQMSGGQMQRVAIARALVNDPDILLADEPTGALDTATSISIMELLKEISKDKLIIMVTHNPELAQKYSTRLVKLLDGRIVDDSNPVTENEALPKETDKAENNGKKKVKKKKEKTSMSFFTALSLSLNNLMTKKTRTLLTGFAGSIGIIGIALILSISSGISGYISKVEEDTLSGNPILLEQTTVNLSSFFETIMSSGEDDAKEENKVYSNDMMGDFMSARAKEAATNNLGEFKKYIDSGNSGLEKYTTEIKYNYSTELNIYRADTSKGVVAVNPSPVLEMMGMQNNGPEGMMSGSMQIWQELLDNRELLDTQYDVVAGRMPEDFNEIVVVVDENNEIYDYTLYSLGLLDQDSLRDMMNKVMNSEELEPIERSEFTYEDILSQKFKLLLNTDYYEKENGIWVDRSEDELYLTNKLENALEINVVGIIRQKKEATAGAVSGSSVGYTHELMEYLITKINESEIVSEQKQDPETDVFSGLKFDTDEEESSEPLTMEGINAYIASLPEDERTKTASTLEGLRAAGKSDEEIVTIFQNAMKNNKSDATYETNLSVLGVSDLEEPSSIGLYPVDFNSKDEIEKIISAYNDMVRADGHEEMVITYTDYFGMFLSSVTVILNAISYVLVAFVSISLVVSSIMIGIITYISVLERTKEIGILRSIGASKKDISRVFNAETLIVGFISGVIGIGGTLLLLIPINLIIGSLTDISGLAALPWAAGIILVAISMLLTFIAGLIPARIAAKKDPVVALRTE